ncbi:hypothetical protein [Sphingobium sp. YR768]|uniref:hypothetical protein n=1 Tax=Sphingobium sp. YR768 TaxID=1884365 RepID=UPI00115FDB2D|nr:hypothetical protein [Sphingobium sp. YR768]
MTNHPNRASEERTLSQAISDYRTRHNLTQQAMAEELGVSSRSLEGWSGVNGGGKSAMSRALIKCLDRL